MTRYFGPFLKLDVDNQPESWFVYTLSDDKTLAFYQKGLYSGESYQLFEYTKPFYALTNSSMQKCMFTQLNGQFYQANENIHGYDLKDILNDQRAEKMKKTLKLNPNFFFHLPKISGDLIKYFQISENDIQNELSNTENNKPKSEPISSAVESNAQTYSYSIESLVQGQNLTPTQQVVVDTVRVMWNLIFQTPLNEDDLDLACKKLLGFPVNASINQALESNAHIFRENFLIPSNIAKNFPDETVISEVCDFLSQLVLKVYKKTFPDRENLKYQVPQAAYKTVGEFNKESKKSDGPVYEGDAAFAHRLQDRFNWEDTQAIIRQIGGGQADLNQGYNQDEQQPEENDLLVFFRNTLKDQLFPAVGYDLNIVQKVYEWICNWCAILDICCLQLSQTASKYKDFINNPEGLFDNSIFGNDKSYQENIYDEFVAALRKGR